jgi:transcriptional regulator with XRE-family HTH domain
MITGRQVRAARAMLRWTALEAAQRAGLSLPTIQRIEQKDDVGGTRAETLMELQRAFEEAGIEFVGSIGDGPGVRFRG